VTLPSISLITPSFNKADFLGATLQSVLNQAYPALEYGIVDGGSTDGTLDIIETAKGRLAFFVSEPDDGMYDALAKGFARSTGEIMGYLGADDLHMPWTLALVGEIFAAFPDVQWITSCFPLVADGQGRIVRARYLPPPSRRRFFQGANLPGFSWRAHGWIQQESTFWRRSLWEKAQGIDRTLKLAGDFDLWCRFMKLAEPLSVETPLAAFRRHGFQISSQQPRQYGDEALGSLLSHGGKPSGWLVSRLAARLDHIVSGSRGKSCRFDFATNAWRLSDN
jgi:glycosyltransferase involved in cell wall biosynthesis